MRSRFAAIRAIDWDAVTVYVTLFCIGALFQGFWIQLVWRFYFCLIHNQAEWCHSHPIDGRW